VRAGFGAPQDLERPSPFAGMFEASFAIERGSSPHQSTLMPLKLSWWAALASLGERFMPTRREFLTVVSKKVSE